MLRNQRPREHVTINARWEARLMLADELLGRRWIRAEFLWVQVSPAGNAVNVRLLLTARSGRQFFAFAFGEALGSLHLAGT